MFMDTLYRSRIFEPCLELIRKDAILRNKTENIEDYMDDAEKTLENKIEEGKLIIPRLVITTGPRCTLKCTACANLMAHYEHPYDLDINEIIRDIRRVFSLIDGCICVNVIDGEPFIYPQLDILLNELIENDKILYVELTTNGTKIPDDKILKILQDKKIVVNISDYGNITLLSKFVAKMDEYGVISYCISNEKWIDAGDCSKRDRNDIQLKKLYGDCESGKLCKTIMKGKIFDCARASSLYDLHYASNLDYIDLHSENTKKQDVLRFFMKEISNACDYCDFSVLHPKYIEPAEQQNGKKLNKSQYTVIARKDYASIIEAKEWWQTQYNNVVKQNAELKDWVEQLEEAKEYFLGQIANLEKENQNLRGKNEQI